MNMQSETALGVLIEQAPGFLLVVLVIVGIYLVTNWYVIGILLKDEFSKEGTETLRYWLRLLGIAVALIWLFVLINNAVSVALASPLVPCPEICELIL